MPRRLPEKTKRVTRKARRFKGKKYGLRPAFRYIPVREGQEVNVVIDDIGSKGDGVARIGSFLIFVPRAKVGERLNVRIREIRGKFAIAEKLSGKEEEKFED